MKRLCGDCEYSFEHLQGVYVCDIDVKSIHLDQERSDCLLKSKAEHCRVCKSCGNSEQIENKEAA